VAVRSFALRPGDRLYFRTCEDGVCHMQTEIDAPLLFGRKAGEALSLHIPDLTVSHP
jgi:hypothetical protein